jgi:hypothetical protein
LYEQHGAHDAENKMVSIIISIVYQQQIHYSASLQEFTARKDSDGRPTDQPNHFAIITCIQDRSPSLVIVKVKRPDLSAILFLELSTSHEVLPKTAIPSSAKLTNSTLILLKQLVIVTFKKYTDST